MARVPKHLTAAAQRARAGSQRSAADRADRRDRAAQRFERNIHTSLAGRLGREIVGEIYPAGSLLPNAADMCARFSVSRTALREAYSVLTAKAMIVARPKIGTRVRPKTDWNMLDPEVLSWHLQSTPTENFVAELFVLRQMVEPEAAGLAASAHSRATIDRIAEAYGRMDRFKDGAGDLIGADLDFHMRILEATGNHFLTALGGLIRTSLECTFELSWEGASRIQDARLHQHRGIFEAIRDGSPELAKSRMTELLSDSIDDVREYLKQRDATL
jgi:GntR family galactonate operon transcriptional repressor